MTRPYKPKSRYGTDMIKVDDIIRIQPMTVRSRYKWGNEDTLWKITKITKTKIVLEKVHGHYGPDQSSIRVESSRRMPVVETVSVEEATILMITGEEKLEDTNE